MKIAVLGQGRMGANMTERIKRSGHEVVRFDMNPEVRDASSLAEVVSMLEGPRVLWMMLPLAAIPPTLDELEGLLEPGDIVVDGGNSYWRDSQARHERFKPHGVGYVDCGTSGGVWGLENGYALMVGGDKEHVEHLMPIFDALRPAEGGFVHAGPSGAGGYSKATHNGTVEMISMLGLGEAYAMLSANPVVEDPLAVLKAWQHGSVVRSWLLDLAVNALEADPGLASIKGVVQESGTGRWTVKDAVDFGVPVPGASLALFERFASQLEDSDSLRMIAALRNQFGGHAVTAKQADPQVAKAGDAPGGEG